MFNLAHADVHIEPKIGAFVIILSIYVNLKHRAGKILKMLFLPVNGEP